jgi:hypothetical protein
MAIRIRKAGEVCALCSSRDVMTMCAVAQLYAPQLRFLFDGEPFNPMPTPVRD